MDRVTNVLHPNWQALIRWAELHPNSSLSNVVFQDGVPQYILVPTDDGLGQEKIRLEKVARKLLAIEARVVFVRPG